LGARGIAGVCIEDKLFPKSNSLLESASHRLAEVDEFCGRIKAAKDHQTDPDFVVVARTEAFICGLEVGEALRRAHAYREAGADAILVHSRRDTASDIDQFMRGWNRACPVLVVPTTYYTTPSTQLADWGVSTVIWANHSLRAAIQSMQEVCQRLVTEKSLMHVQERVVPLAELFRLQQMDELKEAERRYLPPLREVIPE
jgi:phosphoenolpyruvate phosphomutase